MNDIENDKRIIENLKEATSIMQEFNKPKKAYLFENKVFASEYDLEEYLKNNLDKFYEGYIKDDIENLINEKFEEAEEVELIGFN